MHLNKSQKLRIKTMWKKNLLHSAVFNIKDNISFSKDLSYTILTIDNKSRLRIDYIYEKSLKIIMDEGTLSEEEKPTYHGISFFSTHDPTDEFYCTKKELKISFYNLVSKLAVIFDRVMDRHCDGEEKTEVVLDLFLLSKESLEEARQEIEIEKKDKASA